MRSYHESLKAFFAAEATPERILSLVSFFAVIAVILAFFGIARKVARRLTKDKCSQQVQYLTDKAIHYAGVVIVVMTVFNKLGINFTALLGAAGIVGVAIGFAAQTSVSNVISGLFVMSERAFKLGDVLQVDSVIGTVEAFDLLSVRLRTFDNQFVRIPNETVIKANLVNVTYFPFRRFSLAVGVAYGSDLPKVRTLLLETALSNELVQKEPAPAVIFDGFGASAVNVILNVWGETGRYLDLKNAITLAVYESFAREGIVIPLPQLDVRLMRSAGESPSGFPERSQEAPRS